MSSKHIGALPRPQWLQFLELGRGCTANQSNRFLCGGARLCGNTTGSANAAFLSRWVSILSMTTGSSIQAMTLTAPPYVWQVSMPHKLTQSNQTVLAKLPARSNSMHFSQSYNEGISKRRESRKTCLKTGEKPSTNYQCASTCDLSPAQWFTLLL